MLKIPFIIFHEFFTMNFLIAGPCAIDTEENLELTASALVQKGWKYLRGGAFKPRTSPNSFQGLGEEGLKYLREAGDKFGLLVVTEVMDTRTVELVSRYADMLQIGARNMQNFSLLREVGKTTRAVVLKRGFSCLNCTIRKTLLWAVDILCGIHFCLFP